MEKQYYENVELHNGCVANGFCCGHEHRSAAAADNCKTLHAYNQVIMVRNYNGIDGMDLRVHSDGAGNYGVEYPTDDGGWSRDAVD